MDSLEHDGEWAKASRTSSSDPLSEKAETSSEAPNAPTSTLPRGRVKVMAPNHDTCNSGSVSKRGECRCVRMRGLRIVAASRVIRE